MVVDMEHRWGERIQVDIPVRLAAHPFAVRDGHIIDLSVSGALILTELHARLMARVQVSIVAPGVKHDAPTLAAYVARVYKSGIGIEWCEFAPKVIGALLRATVERPFSPLRRRPGRANLGVSRLSGPLLKHPAEVRAPPEEERG